MSSRCSFPARASAICALLVHLAVLGGSPRGALAQSIDAQRKAAAEALFDEGKRLLGRAQFEAACQRFEQSQDIDPGVGTLLYLGECYQRLGKLASAWAIFREAASAARASGQAERARIGEDRARELRPQLSELALMVPAGQPPGFELLLDGGLVSTALFGAFFPVDVGTHQISARAPGFEAWSVSVQIQGEADRQTLHVALLQPAPRDAAPVQAAPLQPERIGTTSSGAVTSSSAVRSSGAVPSSSAYSGSADLTSPSNGGTQRTVALWVGGGGLLAIAAGVVFGINANSKEDEALAQYCVSDGCFDPRGEALNDSAQDWALAANVSYGLGIAALATGAVLYFTASPQRERPADAAGFRLTPVLGRTSGLTVTGAF